MDTGHEEARSRPGLRRTTPVRGSGAFTGLRRHTSARADRHRPGPSAEVEPGAPRRRLSDPLPGPVRVAPEPPAPGPRRHRPSPRRARAVTTRARTGPAPVTARTRAVTARALFLRAPGTGSRRDSEHVHLAPGTAAAGT